MLHSTAAYHWTYESDPVMVKSLALALSIIENMDFFTLA